MTMTIEFFNNVINLFQLGIGPLVMMLGLYTVYTCIITRAGLVMWLLALFTVALAAVPTLFTVMYFI